MVSFVLIPVRALPGLAGSQGTARPGLFCTKGDEKTVSVSKTPRLTWDEAELYWVCVRCQRLNLMCDTKCSACGDQLSEKDVAYRTDRAEFYKQKGWTPECEQ